MASESAFIVTGCFSRIGSAKCRFCTWEWDGTTWIRVADTELAALTDQELLTYEREHHGDPYMTLVKAKVLVTPLLLSLLTISARRTPWSIPGRRKRDSLNRVKCQSRCGGPISP
jgi:hypothetical protein